MKIDETTIAIIRHLREGKKSLKKIAEELSIAENTVRARVNKLEEEGIMEICGLVDPTSLPEHKVVIIGVKLSMSKDIVAKGEEFSKLYGVVSVSVVTGRFDLILVVTLTEKFGLLEFYSEQVNSLEGVQSVETFIVYKGYNLKIPYVL